MKRQEPLNNNKRYITEYVDPPSYRFENLKYHNYYKFIEAGVQNISFEVINV